MNPLFSRSNLALFLLALCVFSIGCTIETANAEKAKPAPVPPPTCQQPDKARNIGTRFLFSPDENHYAQVIPDPADKRYARVLTDGVLVRERFDAGSVGPIVFHPDGERFALIATQAGQKYILEYASGGETPYFAERVEDAWKNWVCYGAQGKNLFAIAKRNQEWHLYARATTANASFVQIPLHGNPSKLELVQAREGEEGFQFVVETAQMQMQVKSWLK